MCTPRTQVENIGIGSPCQKVNVQCGEVFKAACLELTTPKARDALIACIEEDPTGCPIPKAKGSLPSCRD